VAAFRFSHPIEVRYADLDPQRHVNNAVVFSYLEQARARYLQQLQLWDGRDFDRIGIIIAEASASYQAPIAFLDRVVVEVKTTRLGTKSLDVEYLVRSEDGSALATGRTVLVAYDYERAASIPLPEAWRRRIAEFEGIEPGPSPRAAGAEVRGE
jgi:acyl-CoA thioester hydrolase